MSENRPDLPVVADTKPFYMQLQKGEAYLWCSCGLSRQQPFCDQSHRGTAFKPLRYVAREQDEEVLFCKCKKTRDQPFCDGAHNNIAGACSSDDPFSAENLAVALVSAGDDGRALLNGGCFVGNVGKTPLARYANLSIGKLISAHTGALYQSLFYAQVLPGDTPVLGFGQRHVVILVTGGEGCITISGQRFSVAPEIGVHVRPGEAFSIANSAPLPIHLFISVCPLAAEFDFLAQMPADFDTRYPHRTVAIDPHNRNAMGNRFFQVLVDKRIGSDVVTQFIGEIPLSKAMPHRHLYEESLIILRGTGFLWTEDRKAAVAAGDIIFLPRKQIHSLECTDPDGFLLAGVIYPGDNPSINYL